MLSVLIPVFNEDVRNLVNDLNNQLIELGFPFEVRVYDDGSNQHIKDLNKTIASNDTIIYEELPKNIGRSAIRNKLAQEAKGDWFWFLDCDSQVGENTSLVKLFWEEKSENSILSGGRVYQNTEPENKRLKLHWLWGSQRELLDTELRMKDPVNNFLSNNFMLHKSTFEKVRFDTMLFGYGYEDTLFAAEAVKEGISIKHIENPVIHAGLEPADAFLKKIEESLDNLYRLKDICKEKGIPFPVKSKLMLAYKVLNFPIIKQLFGAWFVRNSNIWRIQLLGKNPDLRTFDAYRLAYLLSQ
jgi:glycosyltransferase involved in cell wall biosynthesis